MLGNQNGLFGSIGGFRSLDDPYDPRRNLGPRPMGPAALGMPGLEVAYETFPQGLRPVTSVIPPAIPGDAPAVRLGSGNSGSAFLAPPSSTAVTDPYGEIVGYRPGSRVSRLVQLQRQGEMRGRPLQVTEDPVVELLGEAFATPEDLQRYDRGGTTRGDWEAGGSDPFDTAKNRKGTRPYAEFTTVDVPARLPSGAWRNADGRVNTMRIDPTRQVATVTLDSDATFASDRERPVNLGQLAESLMGEYSTPAIGPAALAAAQQSGRFLPAINPEPGQSIGMLRRLTSAATPGERPMGSPAAGRIAPRQEVPRRQMRYEEVPVYEGQNFRGEPFLRLGSPLPRDYEAIRGALAEALPPGSAGQVSIDPVAALQASRRNQYITPVALQRGVDAGFQFSDPDPETGVMSFSRPDGSAGFLVPEKVLAAGDVPTPVSTGRYIVATPEVMARTERSYGPGPLLPGGAERAWQAKQADLGGMELSTLLGELRQGGQSQGPERLTDTARLVAQIAQERGIPLAALATTATAPGRVPPSSTRLQELRDAAQLLANQAAIPVQGVIPGLPSTRELRSARWGSPQSRRQERLYTAPSTPLPVTSLTYDQPALFALPEEVYASSPAMREPTTFAALAQDINTSAGGNLGLRVTDAEALPVSGLAPRQAWIPGVPSAPAELAVPLSAEQQRVLDYWSRAGRRDALDQVSYANYAEPRMRPRQLNLFRGR